MLKNVRGPATDSFRKKVLENKAATIKNNSNGNPTEVNKIENVDEQVLPDIQTATPPKKEEATTFKVQHGSCTAKKGDGEAAPQIFQAANVSELSSDYSQKKSLFEGATTAMLDRYLNYIKEEDKGMRLYNAALLGELESLNKLLTKKEDADPNWRTVEGITPLMAASKSGQVGSIKTLLDHGAGINLRDKEGKTALIYAVDGNQVESIAQLLERDANSIQPDNEGRIPYTIAKEKGFKEAEEMLLNEQWELYEVCEERGRTLYNAACNGESKLLEELLSGADSNWQTAEEMTPLMAASRSGNLDCVKILIDHNANINQTDKYGMTALHYAAAGNHIETMALLLEQDADTQLTDNEGRTPFTIAQEKGHENAMKMINGHLVKKQNELKKLITPERLEPLKQNPLQQQPVTL